MQPRILIDTRESLPWQFASRDWKKTKSDNSVKWEEVRKKLSEGDYSLEFDGHDMSHLMVIERKALQDFLNCLSGQRDRFFAELERGKGIRRIYIVVEGSIRDVVKGRYRGKISQNAVFGSMLAIEHKFPNVRCYWTGDKENGNIFAEYILRYWWIAINRHYSKTEGQKSVCPYLDDPIIPCGECNFYDKEIEENCRLYFYGEA